MAAAAPVTSPVAHSVTLGGLLMQGMVLALRGELPGEGLAVIPPTLSNPSGTPMRLPGSPDSVVATGSPNVFWNNEKAGRVGDETNVGEMIKTGSLSVYVNGMPAARVGDTLVRNGVIIWGSPNVIIGGGTTSEGSMTAQCQQLAHAREMALLADQAEGMKPGAPPGYTQLDPNTPEGKAALAKLGVTPQDLQPTDSQFRAQVYQQDGPNGPHYVVAYKGTTPSSGSDWYNNAKQGLGFGSDYYGRAMGLANTMNQSSGGNVEFTGHSLGGGMASAAAVTTGRPANTFNAAGLNSNTVGGFPDHQAQVDAWHNPGDPLSTVQEGTSLPLGYGAPHPLPLVQPPGATWYQKLNPVAYHGMDYIIRGIDAERKAAGCPGT